MRQTRCWAWASSPRYSSSRHCCCRQPGQRHQPSRMAVPGPGSRRRHAGCRWVPHGQGKKIRAVAAPCRMPSSQVLLSGRLEASITHHPPTRPDACPANPSCLPACLPACLPFRWACSLQLCQNPWRRWLRNGCTARSASRSPLQTPASASGSLRWVPRHTSWLLAASHRWPGWNVT